MSQYITGLLQINWNAIRCQLLHIAICNEYGKAYCIFAIFAINIFMNFSIYRNEIDLCIFRHNKWMICLYMSFRSKCSNICFNFFLWETLFTFTDNLVCIFYFFRIDTNDLKNSDKCWYFALNLFIISFGTAIFD